MPLNHSAVLEGTLTIRGNSFRGRNPRFIPTNSHHLQDAFFLAGRNEEFLSLCRRTGQLMLAGKHIVIMVLNGMIVKVLLLCFYGEEPCRKAQQLSENVGSECESAF